MEQILTNNPDKEPHERIFEILFDKDELTWQSIIQELIKTEQMDPWDVNISLLTKKYIETIKKLKELDFRVSGKVLLAAAILLKIKSNKLVGEDIEYLDRLISQEGEEDLVSFEDNLEPRPMEDIPKNLIPRTPQPRKRKVSIYDLMGALERALEVKRRRVLQSMPAQPIDIPVNVRDITSLIRQAYKAVNEYYGVRRKQKLMFSQLAPSGSRDDRIFTFVPLLHLSSQQRIALAQETHFSDFSIALRKPGEEQENSKLPE